MDKNRRTSHRYDNHSSSSHSHNSNHSSSSNNSHNNRHESSHSNNYNHRNNNNSSNNNSRQGGMYRSSALSRRGPSLNDSFSNQINSHRYRTGRTYLLDSMRRSSSHSHVLNPTPSSPIYTRINDLLNHPNLPSRTISTEPTDLLQLISFTPNPVLLPTPLFPTFTPSFSFGESILTQRIHPQDFFFNELTSEERTSVFHKYHKEISSCHTCHRISYECLSKLCGLCCNQLKFPCTFHGVSRPAFDSCLDYSVPFKPENYHSLVKWYEEFLNPLASFCDIMDPSVVSLDRDELSFCLNVPEDFFFQPAHSHNILSLVVFRLDTPVPSVFTEILRPTTSILSLPSRCPSNRILVAFFALRPLEQTLASYLDESNCLHPTQYPALLQINLGPNHILNRPARGIHCRHAQCFDLLEYLVHSRITCLLKDCFICLNVCPNCNLPLGKPKIDNAIYNLIHSEPSILEAHSILLEQNGSWKSLTEIQSLVYQVEKMALEDARTQVKKLCDSGCEDLKIGSITFSLKCPLSQKRIAIPARTRSCKHAQCFDLESFLQYYLSRGMRDQSKWSCPVCKVQNANINILYVDSLLLSLLSAIPESTNKIVISEDGEIIVQENIEEKTSEVIDLTEDQVVTVSPNPEQNDIEVIGDTLEIISSDLPVSSSLEISSNSSNTQLVILRKQLELLQQEKEKIQQENEKLKEKTKCSICLENEIRILLLPCRHSNLCNLCSTKLSSCPICRTKIKQKIEIFL